MTDAQLKKRLAQQRRYQERAKQRQMEKQRSPEYIARQREKQRLAAERQHAKMIANKEKLVEKSRLRSEAQYAKAREREKQLGRRCTKKPMKSRGMAGKSRTKADLSLHDKLGQLGCICCINAGLVEPFSGSPVSIHHIRGRTVADAHKYVLPLCAWHHDTPIPPGADAAENVFPIHSKGSEGGKVKWESVNGAQMHLWEQVMKLVGVSDPKDNPEC